MNLSKSFCLSIKTEISNSNSFRHLDSYKSTSLIQKDKGKGIYLSFFTNKKLYIFSKTHAYFEIFCIGLSFGLCEFDIGLFLGDFRCCFGRLVLFKSGNTGQKEKGGTPHV